MEDDFSSLMLVVEIENGHRQAHSTCGQSTYLSSVYDKSRTLLFVPFAIVSTSELMPSTISLF